MIRVLIADDHAVFRAGLRLLLSAQPDIEVVGEAEDGWQTLRQAEALRPDVILLDLTMPGMPGLQALALLRRQAPEARVLILTMHEDEAYLRQALAEGAAGYIIKRATDEELITAIRAVARGDLYIHPAMTRALLEDLIPAPQIPETPEPWESLSERERQVLRMVAIGHTNQEIAERLGLSVKTVETYRARGMEKLGLRTRAQLVRYMIQKGLLKEE
ncbi:response regulator transcription factor [Thermoflexus hugenholtzii]|jgi:two component transcriptional regulator, LuxR family|uniref:Two component transcriptional regulator, LuxR family n=1 Tax=Thermoflexus hugenholtzii JAD2 TaxID=877466 RepID=A0A212QPP1_9CHLR|nr:response regulator transcription factor [Thermoflexus hugenholtzii]SNB61241.1 two component transcriptional regulator, LuxR family [Thermoflexus hugenholtzii JAD2]